MSHEIKDEEVIVLGSLRAGNIIKQQFGTYKRTKGKNGETSLGDDLKAGASDALKKCATLFGVALYLYTDNGNRKPVQNKQEEKEMDPFPLPNEEHPKERTSDEKPNSSRKTVPGASTKKPITIRQIAKVLNMIKDKKLSEDFVRNNIKEHYHQTFCQRKDAQGYLAKRGLTDLDVLRAFEQ